MEFTLLGRALLAMGTAWLTVRALDRTGAISERAARPWDTILGAAMVGLLAGRLWAMVAGGTNPISNPLDVIFIRGGVDTVGASLGAFGALLWWTRSSPARALDALAVPALTGLAAWHAGCAVTGSCAGTETALPWAIESSAGVGRHPVEVYAALGLTLVASLLLRTRHAPPGAVAALALTAVAGIRLATEPLRLHLGDGLVVPYSVGVSLGLIGLLLAKRTPLDGSVEEPPAEHE